MYGLPQRIANRIGRNLGLRSSLMTRRLPFRLQEGRDLAAFLSALRHGLCGLASCLCRQLFTLASDDSRNLRRDDKTYGSRFADMLEEDRVALLFLTVRLHDIELRAADAERRNDTRNACFCAHNIGSSRYLSLWSASIYREQQRPPLIQRGSRDFLLRIT